MPKRLRKLSDIENENAKKKQKRVHKKIPDVEADDVVASPLDTATATPAPKEIEEREYNAKDFNHLLENEHMRYLANSKKIGHAVILKNSAGEEVALQYPISQTEDAATQVRPLKEIESIDRFNLRRFRAKTPNNTVMYATRFIDLEVGASEDSKLDPAQIACFSPKKGAEPFWGGKEEETPLFKTKISKGKAKDLKAELKEIKPTFKGGTALAIEGESVKLRDAIKTRKPDQNTVMGESAKDAYAVFLDSMMDELHPDMKERLKRAVEAPLRDAFYSNYRPEWLHAEGFSLTPMSKNPQRKDNLGAAPKWANTEMMVLERVAKWYALNRPHAFVKIKPHFEMLLDSELVKKINFEVTIQEKERFIKLLQTINPFKKHHLFRKASDIAQGVAISRHLLEDTTPLSQQKVINGAGATRPPAVSLSSLPSSGFSSIATAPKAADASLFAASAKKKLKPAFPTHLKYEKSVVQVYTTSQTANYDEPWKGTHVSGCSGSGLVVSHEGKNYILTNAHCVEDSVVIRVRLANDRKKKYEATRKCVSYQCDLALLEVADPEFHELAAPASLGEMVKIYERVHTVGFPMGGNEVSVSKGIVSRIEVRDYCMSGLDMLQVQVDAAINSGNSGGPVFSDNKVVGVAFQGYDKQGLGYMIPIPIIRHFLTEALSNKIYRGFPVLPILTQTLENPSLRRSYGMTPDQTGVRISKVDYLCDAYNKLKPDDILLEIDSLPISNEGTVDIPIVGKCIDFIHVTHVKYIGDSVTLTILRKNTETKKPEVHKIEVTLDKVPHETEMVPQTEHDKMPTYFIASGISFIPLTRNYMEGRGSDLEDWFLVEEGCSIADLPKKSPDEQFVVINDVLDCEETQGYDEHLNSIVKEVNGKPITNFRDLVAAIENNKEPFHTIMTSLKNKIVVKNLSQGENEALLKRYHIKSDRSEDLKIVSLSSDPARVAVLGSIPARPIHPSPAFPRGVTAEGKAESKEEKRESKDELDGPAIEANIKKSLGDGMMPGVKKYLSFLDHLEDRVKDLPELDEDEDEEYEDKNASDNSDTEEEDEEASEEAVIKKVPAVKLPNKSGFYQPANKSKDHHDEDERPEKRARR